MRSAGETVPATLPFSGFSGSAQMAVLGYERDEIYVQMAALDYELDEITARPQGCICHNTNVLLCEKERE